MAAPSTPFIVGWLEWLALPELGLPAIKAKIDTGARSSALHAFQIETFGPVRAPMVRFGVHPLPGRRDVAVFCSAPVIDRREVTSSNGERETRIFIRTPVEMGGHTWPIEIGLTDRGTMAYRMLLGRQAIREDMMVDAATSFRQPRLSSKLYHGMPLERPVERVLRIALLARGADRPFNRRLADAAAARGHVLELLELDRISLTFEGDAPGLAIDGRALEHYDAVIPRIGRPEGTMGAATVRQLELMGSIALNSGDAIDRVSNRLAAAQALAVDRLPQCLHVDGDNFASVSAPAEQDADALRCLVIGKRVVAVLSRTGDRDRRVPLARIRTERRLAEHAATALRLGLATIEIAIHDGRPVVRHISARPALGRFARTARVDAPAMVIAAVESRLRTSDVVRTLAMAPT